MAIRAFPLPNRHENRVLVVWSIALEASDFTERRVQSRNFTYFGTTLDKPFEDGMKETLVWMERKGLKTVSEYINFLFLSGNLPWGNRGLHETVVAKTKDVLDVGRWSIVSRAWQIVRKETDFRVYTLREGEHAGAAEGASVGQFGLPNGLEVSLLAKPVEAKIPTCWERIVEAT